MSEIVIDHSLLTKLFRRNNFLIPNGMLVFFGIRGALPIDYAGTPFAEQQKLRFTDIDNARMRCTIGQWRPADKTIAVFPGSTVPSVPNIKTARAAGGVGANMLMLGLYEFARGTHKPGKPSGHRAFRQNKFFPVWRTSDDLDYDLDDRVDIGSSTATYFWDNLHCAYHDNLDTSGFSSAGCQVVCGQPMSPHRLNKPETGPWKLFIENAYTRSNGQTVFGYGLFNAAEAGMIAELPEEQVSQSLRFGSSGDLVATLQRLLDGHGLPVGKIDGDFGRTTLECLMAYQKREFGTGKADGIVGPNTAAALGLTLPKLSDGVAPPKPAATPVPPDAGTTEAPDESDIETPAVTGGGILALDQEADRDWIATVATKSFYVGTPVRWSAYEGLYQRQSALPDLVCGQYDPDAVAQSLGNRAKWAWFLLPTIIGESNGYWCRLNSYDGAGLTFGAFQFASHTPNDNLVLLFRDLLKLPQANTWFPDLVLTNGQVCRVVGGKPVSLETAGAGGRLLDFMAYLNPDAHTAGREEALNAARLMGWSDADPAVRTLQVDLAIRRFAQRVNRLGSAYGVNLAKHPIERMIWVADVLHHGRGTYARLRESLNSADPDAALAEIGAQNWGPRIATVKSEIDKLKVSGELQGLHWGTAPFV